MSRYQIGMTAGLLIVAACLLEFVYGAAHRHSDPILLIMAFILVGFVYAGWRRQRRSRPPGDEKI